jgi:hypothetical protein
MDPRIGWEERGMYRIAHERAIKKSYARCMTMKEENDLYEKYYQQELNRFIAKGDRYEALKAKSREERRLEREERLKREAAIREEQRVDEMIGAYMRDHYEGISHEAHVDPMLEMGIIIPDEIKIAQ